MKTLCLVLTSVLVAALAAPLATAAQEPRAADFPGFIEDSTAAYEHRKGRLVDIETFNRMASGGALILDTRSREAYDLRHIRGAVHLNFSDITSESLKRTIGDPDRPILIYCNNNILSDPYAFARKTISMALNIPSFVTLYTYGYRNVYELETVLEVTDTRLKLEGEPLPQS